MSETLRQILLTGEIITSNIIFAEYNLLPGCKPVSHDCYLSVWKSIMPLWNIEPIRKQSLINDDNSGELALSYLRLQQTSYVIAISTSSDPNSLAAMVSFLPGSEKGVSTSVSLKLEESGTDFVRVFVSTLTGNIPVQNNNWIGICPGENIPWDGNGVIGHTLIKSKQSSFIQTISNIKLQFNTLYTLVYGVGESWNDIAATVTFTTNDY